MSLLGSSGKLITRFTAWGLLLLTRALELAALAQHAVAEQLLVGSYHHSILGLTTYFTAAAELSAHLQPLFCPSFLARWSCQRLQEPPPESTQRPVRFAAADSQGPLLP